MDSDVLSLWLTGMRALSPVGILLLLKAAGDHRSDDHTDKMTYESKSIEVRWNSAGRSAAFEGNDLSSLAYVVMWLISRDHGFCYNMAASSKLWRKSNSVAIATACKLTAYLSFVWQKAIHRATLTRERYGKVTSSFISITTCRRPIIQTKRYLIKLSQSECAW